MKDVYRDRCDPTLRIATLLDAGLPRHVDAEDWELMPAGTSQIIDDADADIEAWGFCLFKLV